VTVNNRKDGLDSKAANTTIRRSIVANNSCDGVKLWAGDSRVENTLIDLGAGNAGAPSGAPADDLEGRPRDAHPDMGAYEYRELSARVYLPLVSRYSSSPVITALLFGFAFSH